MDLDIEDADADADADTDEGKIDDRGYDGIEEEDKAEENGDENEIVVDACGVDAEDEINHYEL